MPSAYVQAQIDAALAENANKRRNYATGRTKDAGPTTEPPKEIEAHHRLKIDTSQSAPAQLKPRYYKASFPGYSGNKYTIIDLPDELVPAFKEAMRRVGVKEAT
ncbi:hypothetical protein MUN82_08840 [Hymenobacter aerilatus]|uniref:Uncharacterized protein n=1 Tax=Hymenobacter aerilatus TaxID=2932251 RepID=A0A8T9T5R4_9BACT|nr:hypothetical protein [Hymenobacter aerilatus]UOR07189.1 hypothetical protein MUN82_08840 [Hymenobacter aerilatus]